MDGPGPWAPLALGASGHLLLPPPHGRVVAANLLLASGLCCPTAHGQGLREEKASCQGCSWARWGHRVALGDTPTSLQGGRGQRPDPVQGGL